MHAALSLNIQRAMQAMFMTDMKVHHKYTPKQSFYLNYGAAASEVSILFAIMILCIQAFVYYIPFKHREAILFIF